MSFFKNIFSKKEAPRSVNSVSELQVNDMILLTDSFALPENLRAQQFQISAINSYEYEHHTQTEWVLSGQSDLDIFLTVEQDDKSYLKFTLKIEHSDVETLFNLDEFASVFDEPGNTHLIKQSDSSVTSGWTATDYFQHVFANAGYFHRKDHRVESLSVYEGKEAGEQFELYTLYNEAQSHGIDIEVWQDGDTDVCLILYRPMSDIVDMFPGS